MVHSHPNQECGYACIHAQDQKNLANVDNELVCIICGAVQSEVETVDQMSSPENKAQSLYQSEVGNPHKLLPPGLKLSTLKKIRHKKSSLSIFSTICESLKFPNNASIQAWTMFSRIYKKQNMKKRITKSCAAKYSLFLACEFFAIPRTEKEIDSVLKQYFNVKTVPKYVKCCSLLKYFVQHELKMNVDTDTLNFHINVYLREAQAKYDIDPVELRQAVWKNIENFSGNPKSKSRKAVRYVLKGVVMA